MFSQSFDVAILWSGDAAVGQQTSADDHDRVSGDSAPRPLKFRAEELLAVPAVLDAPAIEQTVDHNRNPVHPPVIGRFLPEFLTVNAGFGPY